MPVAAIRGVEINYEVLGGRGPWVALQPGGRRGLDGVKSLGEKLAEAGNRVLVYDRRNCGASGVAFEGDAENEVWAEDLRELLLHLDALPAFVGGSSSGCRLALLLGVAPPGGGARPAAVAGDRRRLCGRAPGAAILHAVYRAGRNGRHGGGLRERAFQRDGPRQPVEPRAADGDRTQGFYRAHGALAAELQRGRRPPGDRVEPGRIARDDDAGLYRPRQRPGPSARPRASRAPADAACRIP